MPLAPYTDAMMSTGGNSIRYPNPFFDLASTYIPKNIKTLFRFCRDYYKLNGWLSTVIRKMATYPITDILFDSSCDPQVKKVMSETLNDFLRIKSFLIEVGLDYYIYGNVFISTFMKPVRFLKCSACGEESKIDLVDKLCLYNYEFKGTCPVCQKAGIIFSARDEDITAKENFRLLRWAPDNVEIDYNPITGSSIYYYNIPQKVRSQIAAGNPAMLRDIPLVFLKALKEKKRIELEPSNLYHMKYPAPAEEDMGFGVPMLLPAIKDIYFLQTLVRGNEAIANEHIIPKKAISPANTMANDPFGGPSLGTWRGVLEESLKKWKIDPNYIGIFPIPIQYQELGGNAKMLMTTQEEKFIEEKIIVSLGVPLEFIKGGTSWTGSSVSLRIVENGFLNYRELLLDFLNYFLIPKLTALLGYPTVKVTFKKFKMSDDSESKQLAINLNASGKLSDPKLLDEFGYDPLEESTTIKQSRLDSLDASIIESEKQATAQGKAQVILAKYQAEAQMAAQDVMFKKKLDLFSNEIANELKGMPDDPFNIIDKYAVQFSMMPPPAQQQMAIQMQKQIPVTFSLVYERSQMYQANMAQMMQPVQDQQQAEAETAAKQQQGQGKPKDGEPPNKQKEGTREKDKVKITKDDMQKKHGPTKGEA